MTLLEEVEVGLMKNSIQGILEGMIKAVTVDQDQVRKPVLIEIELYVLNVGNMIISVKQEIEEDKLGTDNIDGDKVNPYHNILINNINKENVITSQREQWSILSNIVNYVQYDRNPKSSFMSYMLKQYIRKIIGKCMINLKTGIKVRF